MIYSHEKPRPEKIPGELFSVEDYSFPQRDPGLQKRMAEYLSFRGLSERVARYNGVYPSSSAGDHNPRLVFRATGLLPFWQARLMEDSSDAPRYLSPHWKRGDSVIVAWPCSRAPLLVGVVEGPMDALALAEIGFLGIALMGNTPPPEVLERVMFLCHLVERPAYIIPDRDAVEQGIQVLEGLTAHGVRSRLVLLPPHYKDCAEIPYAYRKYFFKKVMNVYR